MRSRSSTLSLAHGSALGSRRFSGLVFVFLVFISFVCLGLQAARPRSLHSLNPLSSKQQPFVHPITHLMDNAEDTYRKKLSSQSKTLAEAVAEYKRRYNRPPPQGFDDWFKFATENDVVFIDEYDGLMNDLAPFWNMSGRELRRRAEQAGSFFQIDLVRIRNGEISMVHIQDGEEVHEVSGRASGFKSMMEDFAHKLPDLDFAINAQSQGRVLVPWEASTRQDQDSSEESEDESYHYYYDGQGNLWENWRRTCQPSENARQLFSSLRNPTVIRDSQVSFVTSPESQFDYCGSPYAHYLQGHFFADARPLDKLYPVFSPAKAKGFSDIRVPSHYYYGSTKRYTYGWDPVNLELKDVDNMEVPWDEKSDRIYYRGISSGGGTNPPGFSAQYHRHRFVRMASDDSPDKNLSVIIADPPNSDNYISASVPIGTLNDEIMDVAFVLFADENNYVGGKDAMNDELRLASSTPLNRNWAFKYNVDLDGTGYSGRFMAFLASDSVPLKATVYEEFYSDWIQPWLHYIPLSQTYHEIYNIHTYFSGGTPSTLEAANSTLLHDPPSQEQLSNGDARLRRIARAGKVWQQTAARKVDLQAYVYRLCLEYARLSADDRDTRNYS